MIDQLKFDQQFLSVLSLIGSTLTLAGMFVFRRFMAERSIAYVVGFLTVIGTILTLPIVSMFYGLHEWTARMTGGIVDARFIALIDTALESPFGQISMIPMLAWIANSAPANLKATFFAVMASFTNLALSLSQLGTKYMNDIFVVSREVRDPGLRRHSNACRLQPARLAPHRATVPGPCSPLCRDCVCSAHPLQERVVPLMQSRVWREERHISMIVHGDANSRHRKGRRRDPSLSLCSRVHAVSSVCGGHQFSAERDSKHDDR